MLIYKLISEKNILNLTEISLKHIKKKKILLTKKLLRLFIYNTSILL